MMKLNFEFLDEPLEINGLTSVILEDKRIFAKVIQELYRYTGEVDYLKLFDESYKSLKSAELMIITDVLGFDVNSASVLKLIYQDLELQISEKPEVKTEIENLLQEVTNLVNAELLDFEIDLESDEITFPEVFKVLGVQVEIKSDTIFERMEEIIEVFKYLSKKKLLIFVNCGSYLTAKEVNYLQEYIGLHEISCLMLDNTRFDGISKRFVLDGDLILLEESGKIKTKD